jgi:hypothetical protein
VAAGSDNKKAIASPHLQHRQTHVQQTHLPQQSTPKLQTIISKPNQSQQQQQQAPPTTTSPKPIQVPLKQAGQPTVAMGQKGEKFDKHHVIWIRIIFFKNQNHFFNVTNFSSFSPIVPMKAEATQQPPLPQQQKLPAVPARRSSTTTATTSTVVAISSPPASDPPKMKAPQLSEAAKRAQSVVTTNRTPPPIPARSGSVQYSNVPQAALSSSPPQTRPVRRQQTLNSAMPTVIPQAAPEFYIPQRRGSITRQQSSSSVTTSTTSSPKTTK